METEVTRAAASAQLLIQYLREACKVEITAQAEPLVRVALEQQLERTERQGIVVAAQLLRDQDHQHEAQILTDHAIRQREA